MKARSLLLNKNIDVSQFEYEVLELKQQVRGQQSMKNQAPELDIKKEPELDIKKEKQTFQYTAESASQLADEYRNQIYDPKNKDKLPSIREIIDGIAYHFDSHLQKRLHKRQQLEEMNHPALKDWGSIESQVNDFK